MKKYVIFALIIVLSLCLCGCDLLFGPYNFNYMFGEYFTAGPTTIDDAANLHNIHIRWYAGTVTVVTHDEPTVLIEESTFGGNDDAHLVHHWYEKNLEGDSLTIEFGKSGVSDFDGVRKDLKITVPRNDGYKLGITTHKASVNIDFADYENTLEKLSITTDVGHVNAEIYSAKEVQIAGYGVDEGAAAERIYRLNARRNIQTLGMNSSYAKVVIFAREIGSMDSVGSAFNDVYLNAAKAEHVKLVCTRGKATVSVEGFRTMDISAREQPVTIYIHESLREANFTLDITREKAFEGEEHLVSDKVTLDFDNVKKISDTKYIVGDGECTIHITTYNDISIIPFPSGTLIPG